MIIDKVNRDAKGNFITKPLFKKIIDQFEESEKYYIAFTYQTGLSINTFLCSNKYFYICDTDLNLKKYLFEEVVTVEKFSSLSGYEVIIYFPDITVRTKHNKIQQEKIHHHLTNLIDDENYDYSKEREKEIDKQNELNKQQSIKEKVDESTNENIVRCPKCKSTSIALKNKKLSISRGIAGNFILGPAGAVIGSLSSKKHIKVCMNCNKQWK